MGSPDRVWILCICRGKYRKEHCSDRSNSFVLNYAVEIGQNAYYCSKYYLRYRSKIVYQIHSTVAHDTFEPSDLDRMAKRDQNSK
jgi:hypothetical protein